jgi:hypothetical protein
VSERSADQKTLAAAAQPLFASLDDQRKMRFSETLVRISGESRSDPGQDRGLWRNGPPCRDGGLAAEPSARSSRAMMPSAVCTALNGFAESLASQLSCAASLPLRRTPWNR